MKKRNLFLLFTTVLPLVVTLIILPKLPYEIPAHYGTDGVVTRYGSKFEILIVPIMLIIFMIAFLIFSQFVSNNYQDENKVKVTKSIIFFSCLTISIVFNVLTYWFLFSAYNSVTNINDSNFDILKIISVITSLFFIVIGTMLPKCKQNSIMGIRTHWTLSSNDVWYKTHKVGGVLFFVFGLGMTIINLFFLNGIVSIATTFLILLILAIVLTLYSWFIYKH